MNNKKMMKLLAMITMMVFTVGTTAIFAAELPVAVDDSTSVNFGATINIDVLANDYDNDGDPLTLDAITVAPTFGNASIVDLGGGDLQIEYTNTTWDAGGDSLEYQIDDGVDGTATAMVYIDIVDDIAPMIWFDSTTPAAANINGWFNEDVMVNFDASDDESGIDLGMSELMILLDMEGVNLEATGTAYDNAGNMAQEAVDGINIDKTAPTLLIGGMELMDGEDYHLGYFAQDTSIDVEYLYLDNLSGHPDDGSLMKYIMEPIDISMLGDDQEILITLEDRAGNMAEITFYYNVVTFEDLVGMIELQKPLEDESIYTKNRTIPIKFQVIEGEEPVVMTTESILLYFELKDGEDNLITPDRTNHVGDDVGEADFVLTDDFMTYQFNLKTKGLDDGTYTVIVYATHPSDPTASMIGEIEFEIVKKGKGK